MNRDKKGNYENKKHYHQDLCSGQKTNSEGNNEVSKRDRGQRKHFITNKAFIKAIYCLNS